MKNNTYFYCLLSFLFFCQLMFSQENSYTLKVFDKVTFYDGYASISSAPVAEEVIRLDNSRYAKKITDIQRQSILNTLAIDVTIGALCDNYDRIGGVFISLVPKGELINSPDKQTIEIGRFITPFMNKNKQPTEVPYHYDLTHLVGIFKDSEIKELYDIWFELNVFGVPYAANTEVAGCAGRSDVFEGSLTLSSSSSDLNITSFFIHPLANRSDFNNYNATDLAGTTTKIFEFSVNKSLKNAAFHLITSNHGANQNGEEYVRRTHNIYFDNNFILTYKPGGKSCEPFRKYNTQANGIYGSSTKSEAWWKDWNNWCPGDIIPNRIIELNEVGEGQHQFKITVPDAVFYGQDGNFPLSLFLYARDYDKTLSVENFNSIEYRIYPNPISEFLIVDCAEQLSQATLYDITGNLILTSHETKINLTSLARGTYIVKLIFENGITSTEKIVKN